MPNISIKVEVWLILRSSFDKSNCRRKLMDVLSPRIFATGIVLIVGGGGAHLVHLYLPLIEVVEVGVAVWVVEVCVGPLWRRVVVEWLVVVP